MTRRTAFVATVLISLAALAPSAVATTYPAMRATEVKAFFRDGQTFITWKEDPGAEFYGIYRDVKPITTAGLQYLAPIARVPKGSSKFQEMFSTKGEPLVGKDGKSPPWVIPQLCVQPVGEDNKPRMLAEGTGLFAWTVKEEKPVKSYYAVTAGLRDYEDKSGREENTAGPVEEILQPIGAVKYYTQMAVDKKTEKEVPSRDWYIMYMDYELWNAGYVGYAVPFAITIGSFKEGGPTPSAHLDGIGTMNAFTAGYTNYGCGDFSRNALPTWYFGYGTKVKDRASGQDVKQEVANYVQYRIVQTVLWARRQYKLDTRQFHINGNSMGASGNIGFALAFPDLVTTIFSNEGLTDYADTFKMLRGQRIRMWDSSILGNYGKVELANPVKLLPFREKELNWYTKHNGMNVYDFRNAAKFLALNVDKSFPLLLIGHCHQDGSIPAENQAYPFEKYINDSRHTFSYTVKDGGHGWGSAFAPSRMGKHIYTDESRPGFSGVPGIIGWQYKKRLDNSRCYAHLVGWAASTRDIKGKKCIDEPDRWVMPLIHDAAEGEEEDYFCDITPRNLQKLAVKKGDVFAFRLLDLDEKPLTPDFEKFVNGKDVKAAYKSAGEITADEHNLLLVPHVPIHKAGCIVEVTRKNR